jgi:CheY-like chemotaxis protein
VKHRLLLVEDNRMQMLRDWLESENIDVEVAENLAAARAALLRRAPELVLLDVRLGAEDGLDLARWIRATPELKRLPVIAVTAHVLRHEQDQILRQGCNAVVSKPIDFRSLSRQLDLWLSVARGPA